MTTAQKIALIEILRWLKEQGATVVALFSAPTPVITVDRPVKSLIDRAIALNERVNGLNKVTHAARISGVCIKWGATE
ncbi:hypothetical protein [uncultured Tolumonas sp.]|uniref:hypothetical protein n=1 Tax=uncultured Tolumonas sp. TaxID=263765 RepID=UPI002A0A40AB|nr:hypothetical protein [uncultured Tolumonas sp.]